MKKVVKDLLFCQIYDLGEYSYIDSASIDVTVISRVGPKDLLTTTESVEGRIKNTPSFLW